MPDWIFYAIIYLPLGILIGVAGDILLIYREPPGLRGD